MNLLSGDLKGGIGDVCSLGRLRIGLFCMHRQAYNVGSSETTKEI